MNNWRGTGQDYAADKLANVELFLDEEILTQPLHWKRPRMIFVCSMTDLFADFVPDEWIDRIFAVMALCPRHTFQCLTKRPQRMRNYFEHLWGPTGDAHLDVVYALAEKMARNETERQNALRLVNDWPLRNAWLGVSCEDQKTADARIPLLLQTPAAVRWISYEPAIAPVDFRELGINTPGHNHNGEIDWLVCGGESGPHARPCNVQWIRDVVSQCKSASAPVFVKQLGSEPGFVLEDEERRGNVMPSFHHFCDGLHIKKMNHSKGGDPAEWPEELRVREYPS